MKIKYIILNLFVLLLLVGCGYKPSSWYAKQAIQGDVYVDIDIDVIDPRNTVLIKDAMDEIIVSKLDGKLTTKKKSANTILNLKLGSVKLSELQYDSTGYVTLYRIVVPINVKYKNSEKSGTFFVKGDYDFSIGDNTVISDAKRFEAIKHAASNALDELISKLAVEAYRR